MRQYWAENFKRPSRLLNRSTMLALTLAGLAGCNGKADLLEELRIVGSTSATAYAGVIAAELTRQHPSLKQPVVEATGTGSGIEAFCSGIGGSTPDLVFTSRPMKDSEIAACKENGVTETLSFQLAMDGVVLVKSVEGSNMTLSSTEVYKAFAATPYGRAKRPTRWNQINAGFSDLPILLYGPPSSAGTQNAFGELIMVPGCEGAPEVQAIKDADLRKRTCTRVREDGVYTDVGENDRLMTQKLKDTSSAIGLMSFSRAAANTAVLKTIAVDGVSPSIETIRNRSYRGSRPILVYVKRAHMRTVPGLSDYITLLVSEGEQDGMLSENGLIALDPATIAGSKEKVREAVTASRDAAK